MPRRTEPQGEGGASLSDASEVVHQRSRLAVLTVLYEAGEADFGQLRRITGLSDGNLSRHLTVLEEAGLVDIRKGFVGRRPRTWVNMTVSGRSAYEHEVQILRGLVASADAAREAAGATARARGPIGGLRGAPVDPT